MALQTNRSVFFHSVKIRNRAWIALRVSGSVFAILSASPQATAQTYDPVDGPTPEYPVDKNGVNIAGGYYVVPKPQLTIGDKSAPDLIYFQSPNYTNNADFPVGPAMYYQSNQYFAIGISTINSYEDLVLYQGPSSAHMYGSTASGWFAYLEPGASLTAVSGGYQYKERDGTVINFKNVGTQFKQSAVTNAVYNAHFVVAIASSLIEPSGGVINFTYKTQNYNNTNYYRLQAINSSNGNQIKLLYANQTISQNPYAGSALGNGSYYSWFQPISAEAINNSVDYCAPTADSCTNLSKTWPTMSYNTSVSIQATSTGVSNEAPLQNPAVTQSIVTDSGGQSTTYVFDPHIIPNNGGLLAGPNVLQVISPSGASVSLSASLVVIGTGTYLATNLSKNGVSYQYTIMPYTVNNIYCTKIVMTELNGLTRTTLADPMTGSLIQSTDAVGNVTNYTENDNTGQITKIVYPEGNSVLKQYDGRGNVTQVSNVAKPGSGVADVVTSWGYDQSCAIAVKCNQPNWSVDARGNETDYTYDPTSNLIASVTGPAATPGGVRPQTRISYLPKQAYYKNSTNAIVASGHDTYVATTTSVCQTKSGATVNGTPGMGPFSLSGNAACANNDPDETKTAVTYSPAGTANNLYPVSQTVSAGDNSVSATTSQTYDNVGNIVSSVGPLGSGQTTYNFYDADRRLTGTIAPDPDGSGARTPTAIKYTYNVDGVITQTSIGTVLNQVTTLANFSEAYRQLTIVDAYDRPIRTAIYGPGGVAGYAATDTIYDSMGRAYCSVQYMNLNAIPTNPTTTCAPGQTTTNGGDRVTQITYDADNRPLTKTEGVGTAAVAVTSTIAKQTLSGVLVQYNQNGTVPGIQDANGNLTSYTYDGFDHLSSTLFPNATSENLTYYTGTNMIQMFTMRDSSTVTLNYDNLGRVHTRVSSRGDTDTIGYNLQGVVTSTSSSATGNTVSESYDALGRMAQEVQPSGTISYGYNLVNNSSTITWPDRYVATYYSDYDRNVISIAMLPPGGTASSIASYSYDNFGRRTNVSFGNGTSRAYQYDAAGRLLGLQFSFPNAPAYNQLIGSVATGDGGTNIAYSPASQITTIVRKNSAYSWAGSYNVSRNYCPNALNQYANSTSTCTAGTASFVYDLKGNLTSSGTSSYGYDWLNRMTSAPSNGTTYTLAYDPVSRLIGYTGLTTTNFTYAGSNLVEESTSGTVLRRYVPGPATDETVVRYEGTDLGNPHYLQADERGSIAADSDGGGANVTIYTYDEFGIPGPSNSGRFGYTGQAWYREIGLYNYKARWYSPTLGRFIQADPIGYGDGLNMYNYAHGDPVNGGDPFGLADCETDSCFADAILSTPITDPSLSSSTNPFDLPPISYTASESLSIVSSSVESGTYSYDTSTSGDDYGIHSYASTSAVNVQLPSVSGMSPQSKPCGGGLAATIANYADKTSLAAGLTATVAGGLGLVTAPTGAGFVGFESVAVVSGLVSLGASGVGAIAHAVNGDYIGAGLDAAGLLAGPLAQKLAGGAFASGRMFGNLSAGQARQAGLIGNGMGTAAGAAGSLYNCR